MNFTKTYGFGVHSFVGTVSNLVLFDFRFDFTIKVTGLINRYCPQIEVQEINPLPNMSRIK